MSSVIKRGDFVFPEFTGARCLMMPYVQGDITSVPVEFHKYKDFIENFTLERGEIGFLTIDERPVATNEIQRGDRAKYGRAIHTEAGKKEKLYAWGWTWGSRVNVTLDRNTRAMLCNNIDHSCALWDTEHENTSADGDLGMFQHLYPYSDAIMMGAGEVYEMGILTPHEGLPLKTAGNRQFLRIIGRGVHGREPYFTENPLM